MRLLCHLNGKYTFDNVFVGASIRSVRHQIASASLAFKAHQVSRIRHLCRNLSHISHILHIEETHLSVALAGELLNRLFCFHNMPDNIFLVMPQTLPSGQCLQPRILILSVSAMYMYIYIGGETWQRPRTPQAAVDAGALLNGLFHPKPDIFHIRLQVVPPPLNWRPSKDIVSLISEIWHKETLIQCICTCSCKIAD